jgi:putative PIN family toxin of toxin-antitoxin system
MIEDRLPVPEAVCDCMVFLQGAARPGGPAASCIKAIQDGRAELYLSPATLAEIRDVLTRPKLQRKFPILTDSYVEAFLVALLRHVTMVYNVPLAFRYERDPKDEPYLNLAIAAEAQYLVSRDNDLLALMDANNRAGEDFRRRFPGITILDPVRFLDELDHPDNG